MPNYYGTDTVVLRWDRGSSQFVELQRLQSEGGGGVDAFTIGDRQMLAVAEFNVGIAALYQLSGAYPDERFRPWQRIAAPGCGSLSTLRVPSEAGGDQDTLLLLSASYVTRQTGWRTRSQVFALRTDGSAFEPHGDVPTVGAHDVATMSIAGRRFAFYSNDKDERSPRQKSELFEYVGAFPSGRLVSRQKVETDGAHAAEFFSSHDGAQHFLAVANLGDRQANTYRRDSVVFAFDPGAADGQPMLTLAQKLPTLGATDFRAFAIGGVQFLAVSNEQDDTRGGDVASTVWAHRPRTPPKEDEDAPGAPGGISGGSGGGGEPREEL